MKEEFLGHLPSLIIVDGLGSSEAGGQLAHVSAGNKATTGTFAISPGNHVLSADLDRELQAGDEELGWLAKSGRLALGYLGDAAKTARAYPVIDGVRYAVPGDRARLRADDVVELHGRDSVTINSGGEKIFAEEVEAAIKAHGDVYDCVVAGRPSERWGNEVVAVVRMRAGYEPDEASLLAEAERHIARYKLPKAFVFVDEVVRSPSGKADYRWAKQIAANPPMHLTAHPSVSGPLRPGHCLSARVVANTRSGSGRIASTPVSKRAWDSETLPQGDDKVTAVRQMFDAIAPRYDLVNRIMTFRLDVHWRRKAVRSAGPADGEHRDRSRQRNGRPVCGSRPRGPPPAVVRSQLRHARRGSQRCTTCAGRHLAVAAARSIRRRCDVRVRPAQPGRNCRSSSTSSAVSFALVDASRCSTSGYRATG